ncbi:unnamed protein product, partial [Symbiodinium microadriaticum]
LCTVGTLRWMAVVFRAWRAPRRRCSSVDDELPESAHSQLRIKGCPSVSGGHSLAPTRGAASQGRSPRRSIPTWLAGA